MNSANVGKIFNSESYLHDTYTDTDIGNKLSDAQYREYLLELTNTSPINISTKTVDPWIEVTIQRGTPRFLYRLFGKQDPNVQVLKYAIFSDYDAYYPHYSNLELLLSKFLESDVKYSRGVGNSIDIQYKYIQILSTTNLDLLPELKCWIHHQFTRDITRWVRFKRLFQSIALNIHPRVIDTVKWKLFLYLLEQRSKYQVDNTENQEKIVTVTDVNEIHKVMDLMIYLPYVYIFMVYKSLDISGNFAESLMPSTIPEPDTGQLANISQENNM
jgi:hypothetical protein